MDIEIRMIFLCRMLITVLSAKQKGAFPPVVISGECFVELRTHLLANPRLHNANLYSRLVIREPVKCQVHARVILPECKIITAGIIMFSDYVTRQVVNILSETNL